MDTKRIVITGGPGSGKTSLIKFLEQKKHFVLHEVSREVTLEAQRLGIDQLFLTNPILFSKKLLEERLKQFHEAENFTAPILFYDRGMPDVTAYMDFLNIHYPVNFSNTCEKYRYDSIFILPPWEKIYEQDNERYESFEQAEKIFHFLGESYKGYGYKVHNVPFGTLKERADFILDFLKHTP
ncbi:ATPase [Aequorivita sp. H23M31]|uniref:ATPase n=1 Tax=Aequorivita ciconiae TaxID=2494375 RepID=A0A410G0J8_9FLAO|nr:ATP-binding protein [Aequorivita sp. H23M31]QAA80798.1 ATPase [Aequorivita sp. H23M31]